MIANEFQYNFTKVQAAKFEQALQELSHARSEDQIHPILRMAERDALESQLNTLRDEIAEYEFLRSGKRRRFTADSFEELPRLLIQARIAKGLTQKELAEQLGLKEQQIQRYEATSYRSASLARVNEIIQALGLIIKEDAALR